MAIRAPDGANKTTCQLFVPQILRCLKLTHILCTFQIILNYHIFYQGSINFGISFVHGLGKLLECEIIRQNCNCSGKVS